MKFEVTHPKIWKKLAEKNMPMKNKIQIYEKLGGAYRLGESGGEQVFNKMTELLKHKITEGDEKSPEETLDGLKNMAMGDLERIADYANMIENRMKEGQELSSWMYSQITLSVDQLNSVHDAMDGKDGEREPMKEEGPGLWANIRAKKARGEEPAHGNSDAHKDAVAAGKKINKEESVNEAAEIPFDKLTPAHQKQVQAFAKVLSGKPIVIFEGIHGMIVDIKVSNGMGVYRFDTDELKKLLALKIRWVEADGNIVTIGF